MLAPFRAEALPCRHSDPIPPPADPALLRIEGPIATITLNRPAAFNSINLSIAQKLEQLGAEVEANDDIRVLVIEGEGRAFSRRRRSADHRRGRRQPTPSRPSSANC